MSLTPQQRVMVGALRLTTHFGGSMEWLDRIDLPTLDMNDWSNCVLGQVFGGFTLGCQYLRLEGEQTAQGGFEAATALDGESSSDQIGQEYRALQYEWTALVANLRAGGIRL